MRTLWSQWVIGESSNRKMYSSMHCSSQLQTDDEFPSFIWISKKKERFYFIIAFFFPLNLHSLVWQIGSHQPGNGGGPFFFISLSSLVRILVSGMPRVSGGRRSIWSLSVVDWLVASEQYSSIFLPYYVRLILQRIFLYTVWFLC